MPVNITPTDIARITNLETLLAFLRDRLNWDIDPDAQLDDLTFDYSADELNLSDKASARLQGGVVRQLQNFSPNQPWGIFLVEFNQSKLYREALRQILRSLVPNQRKDPSLKSWHHENLLFICVTKNYDRFTFAHFKGDKAQMAKLSTFGWQRNDSHLRTLCEFNLKNLVWPEKAAEKEKWLKSWATAFDKEPLTKDFFKRFDKAINRVKEDLETSGFSAAEAYTRSQLLLERMIFCYFLQNRGWLNQERGYLLNNFTEHRAQPDDFSYYQDFLERLFWTLASAPGSAGQRLSGVPFLNGGLFDDDEFEPTPIRKKHNPPLEIRNATFAFVFDELLEAFNFTVREDTPLNQEVAVDPEMLGKVFESIILHAESADPDAVAPDKRKATGSYYTPRIVVHFICREALRQYLIGRLPRVKFTDALPQLMAIEAADGLDEYELKRLRELLKPEEAKQLLEHVRPQCCDPAVGSGAFPVGLLHELVNLRRVLETVANGYRDPVVTEGTKWLQLTKEDVVQHCLYGVDIQQQAIEICRLRLWLSLVVDYDLGVDAFTADRDQFREAINRISQLPNLEMNFRRGDSLHDYISGVPVVLDSNAFGQYRRDIEAIRDLGEKLHKAKKGERKRKLRLEILARRLELSRRVLEGERTTLKRYDNSLGATLFGDILVSDADKRKRLARELEHVEEALKKVTTDQRELERLQQRAYDSQFYPKLRRLEGADFDSPFNFAWHLDFADIFAPKRAKSEVTVRGKFALINEASGQMEFEEPREEAGGFDIIVGNPPFVTARNPMKNELYRERWKRVCSGKYHLVCPFFELSFGLLRLSGQLGFIVSNAFAKREFGQPLIEGFFPTVDLQKIVDCSGLLFPGHGTPTCIVFGRNHKPEPISTIRIAATLPGGGDLRTPPEESPLWQTLEAHHDQPNFIDSRVIVSDRPRNETAKWPWNLDSSAEETKSLLENNTLNRLRICLGEDVGFMFVFGQMDVFVLPLHLARRTCIPQIRFQSVVAGDDVRNWIVGGDSLAIFPYDLKTIELLKFTQGNPELRWFNKFKESLSNRPTFSGTFAEAGKVMYEYHQLPIGRAKNLCSIAFPEIATHGHFAFHFGFKLFSREAPILKLPLNSSAAEYHLFSGFLNSCATLFWLKQVCFNKGAGEDEERDRFVYAGGKVEQLPVPTVIANALQGTKNPLVATLTELSRACGERGQVLPSLALKMLFVQSSEAYYGWNSALPGYITPHAEIATPFTTTEGLQATFQRAIALREQLRAEMIARQEEMDWLVYEAYGLIVGDGERIADYELQREERPFVLWAQAEGDYDRAVDLIPTHWPDERQQLWRKRLALIRDNEHIRRIEQPVYKRRWDEQWKVGNSWQCGQPAYDAELLDAFHWWLSEKAEWWLEQNTQAVSLDAWTIALWADARIQAAWPVIAAAAHRLELWKWEQKEEQAGHPPKLDDSRAAFAKFFKALVKEQTVPQGIPFGVPYDKLKVAVSAQVKKIRGKLNVPRERFHQTPDGLYCVAAPFGDTTTGKPHHSANKKEAGALPFE